MSDFWNNISRYPRFFVSSLVGSVLVILAPFKNLVKIPKFQSLVIIGFIIFLTLLYAIVLKMAGF